MVYDRVKTTFSRSMSKVQTYCNVLELGYGEMAGMLSGLSIKHKCFLCWPPIMCAAYLLYVLQLVPALTARVRYVPVCTAHPRTVRHTRDNKGYKTQQEKRQSDPQKGSHITGPFPYYIKCTIMFIYGPSTISIPNPVLRLSRITTAVLPVYPALPLL